MTWKTYTPNLAVETENHWSLRVSLSSTGTEPLVVCDARVPLLKIWGYEDVPFFFFKGGDCFVEGFSFLLELGQILGVKDGARRFRYP